jgi:hypothetical protein
VKEIELMCGAKTVVDDEDYDRLHQYNWRLNPAGYALRSSTLNGKYITIRLHREIMGACKGEYVDHVNGNPLDNRKSNLRICTNMENSWNSGLRKDSKSGYKGVTWKKERSKWKAEIKKNYKTMFLGYFDNPHDAARMYNFWAKDMFGEFARLNVIKEEVI